MRRINGILFTLICIVLTNCSTETNRFPIEKRYWEPDDYDEIVHTLRFGYGNDEKLPTFDNPETRIVVEKLTDEQNFKIVLDDDELGIKHRNEVAVRFFNEWKDMDRIYKAIDRKDQYLYEEEMLAVWHFGLGLQLRYFKLGNLEIKESSDDPNAARVNNVINSNIRALINNYQIYLDEINNEDAFTTRGKEKLAEGIEVYFSELINLYPDADYSGMKKKAELMLKKSQSDRIKSALHNLIELINSNETENE